MSARLPAALAFVAAAVLAGTVGFAWAAFASVTSSGPNTFSAAPDLTAPSVSTATVARTSGASSGTIRQGGDYFVYANVADAGNPPSGIATVTANLSSFDTGQAAASLTTAGGPWTVGGTTYAYRSAQLTANTPLTTGNAYAYTITTLDVAGNSATATGYNATVETYAQVVLATGGLVSYWRLGETAGATAADSGGANTGTYVNGVTLNQAGALTGDANRAARFDGANDYVNVADNATLDLTGAVTVEAWVRVNVFDLTWQAMVTKGDSAYRLHRHSTNSVAGFSTTGTTPLTTQGAQPLNDGQWHHVVGVWTNAGNRYIYVDGQLDASSTGVTGTLAANAFALRIGENAQATGRYWDGWIDEVAVYGQALSAADVLDHWNAGKGTG